MAPQPPVVPQLTGAPGARPTTVRDDSAARRAARQATPGAVIRWSRFAGTRTAARPGRARTGRAGGRPGDRWGDAGAPSLPVVLNPARDAGPGGEPNRRP